MSAQVPIFINDKGLIHVNIKWQMVRFVARNTTMPHLYGSIIYRILERKLSDCSFRVYVLYFDSCIKIYKSYIINIFSPTSACFVREDLSLKGM